MPSDSNGVFTLVSGYLAVTGQTIQASQHNPPLEDIATGLTARLSRNGAAPMTGALKLANGTSAAPSLTFADDPTKGFYRDSSGVMRAAGFVAAVPVGGIVDYAGTTAPTYWLFCYGQSLAVASYADLFAAIGYTYGGSGANFSLPDLRGRVSAGQDDMGGTSANRLTAADDGLNGDTLGATGGGETQVLVTGNLPAYTPAGGVSAPAITVSGTPLAAGSPGFSSTGVGSGFGPISLSASLDNAPVFTGTAQGGTSTAFGIVQPTIVLNKIIYAGV